MAVIVGASTSIPLRRRNRNALAAGIWLVFLAYAVMSLQSSHLPPWRIALGWMGLAIFALFYLALFWWHVDGLELWYTKHQVRASAIVGQIMLVVLCALLALVRPKVAASVLAYPIAFAVFQMPEVALGITLAIEVVGMAVLVWVTPSLMAWAIGSAISVAVVTVVGGPGAGGLPGAVGSSSRTGRPDTSGGTPTGRLRCPRPARSDTHGYSHEGPVGGTPHWHRPGRCACPGGRTARIVAPRLGTGARTGQRHGPHGGRCATGGGSHGA